jgi:hypothetical protein
VSADDRLLVDNYWGHLSMLIHDSGRLAELADLSDRATPGPWIRKWESFDVHHMGVGGNGPYALRSMNDLDFAVACVRFVREMLNERIDILDNDDSVSTVVLSRTPAQEPFGGWR